MTALALTRPFFHGTGTGRGGRSDVVTVGCVLLWAIVSATSAVEFDASDEVTTPGETATVTVSMGDAAGLGIVALGLTVTYDPSLLSTVHDTEGAMASVALGADAPDGWLLEQNELTPGAIDVAMAADFAKPLAGPGNLLTVTFVATDTLAGPSALSPVALTLELNEGAVPATVVDGSVTVVRSLAIPDFALRSAWVFDPGPGGNKDGAANPGETVSLRIRLKNEGDAAAQNVLVTIGSADGGVDFPVPTVSHATWPAGEARNNDGLILAVPADATPVDIVIVVDVTADNGGPWQFSYPLSIAPLPVVFVERSIWFRDKLTGNDDGQANPGELLEIRARLKNESLVEAQNVVVSLSSADDVVMVNGQVTHATWPAGVARNNDGLLVEIGPTALDFVTLVIDVTADNGGPWQFTYALPITPLPVVLAERSIWFRDKVTGNDDGEANPGERLEIRARIKNESLVAAQNVVVSLSSADEVTIVSSQVTHATWPAGVARNNNGLLVEIGSTASDFVTLVIDVTADNGGPWQFTYALPITPLPVVLAERSIWFRDKVTGNDDGEANPGERLEIRARIKNESLVAAQNVVVSLSSADEVTIVSSQVTHETWPAGVARNNNGLLVEIGPTASGSVTLDVDVTADNGGPWQFTYSMPVVASPADFAMRSAWFRDKVTGDADGQAEPGERVEVRARVKNEGQTAAENVVVTLSTADANVSAVSGTVTHATWPAGEARNNVGLQVDLGPNVGATVDFVLDITADNGGPWRFEFTLSTATPAAPTALAAIEDVNRDGSVDLVDILTVASALGQPASAYPSADLNGDQLLDIADMAVVERARSDALGGAPSVAGSRLRLAERWLREAREQHDGSRVYLEGIAGIERLLLTLRPYATALLPNYPNPFNPETWIPFDLAEPATVTIAIYDVRGRSVRRIDLGRRDVGKYRRRGEAAYWGGINDAGEPVAGGVYLYELRAGIHRQSRRMIVLK